VPAGAVIDQIKTLAARGVPEVVLTGVDLTSWGADLPGAPNLGSLVARILKLVPELKRLRLSSLDAIEMDETLFTLVTGEERIAPHLHLSLQHGHDMILKRMKRRHLRADAVDLCRRLKDARPEIALGADLIAGFPTETDEHFEASLALIEDCALSYVHVFPFSPRTGTPAARMPQLDRALIKARAARLRGAADAALIRHLETWIGCAAIALIETKSTARLPDFTPIKLATVSPPACGEGPGVGGAKVISAQSNTTAPYPSIPSPQGGGEVLIRLTSHDSKHLIGVPA
jgi:threonylcarbamoyladenosine tRNA methylthiotransferase MtaB